CLARHCVAPLAVEPGVPEKPREALPKEGPPEKPPTTTGDTGKSEALLSPYYQQLQSRPMKEVIDQARKALAKSETSPVPFAIHRDRPNSVTEIITQAVGEAPLSDRAAGYVAQPMPQPAPTPAPPLAATVQPAKRVTEQPVVPKPAKQANEQPVV